MNKSCPIIKKCGKCYSFDIPYSKQLSVKQKRVEQLLKQCSKINKIEGMKDPYGYSKSIKSIVGHQKGEVKLGFYKPGTHTFVVIEDCLIEDPAARAIAESIRGMMKSFKIRTYDEDSGYGFLRYILVKKAITTGQIMVVLVTASPIFPSKNNFVKALKQKHPEITTIVQNINERVVNVGLGTQEKVLYGKGYIEDALCGCNISITSKSKNAVNPVQEEILYKRIIGAAKLKGKEVVFNTYSSGGVLGIMASKLAKQVIEVEGNKDAGNLARDNVKLNQAKNIQLYQNDAVKLLKQIVDSRQAVDVVILDASKVKRTKDFCDVMLVANPKKIIYVANLASLEKDIKLLEKTGYKFEEAWAVDMLPWTTNVETVVMLGR